MGVKSSESGDTVTIQVAGRFDFATHRDFVGTYKDIPKGAKKFVVDLANTDYLDSSALGMLLQLRQHARTDAAVELRSGSEGVEEILRIANFDKLFKLV